MDSMYYRLTNTNQEVSNTNHFGSVSDGLGRLAACECLASLYIFSFSESTIFISSFPCCFVFLSILSVAKMMIEITFWVLIPLDLLMHCNHQLSSPINITNYIWWLGNTTLFIPSAIFILNASFKVKDYPHNYHIIWNTVLLWMYTLGNIFLHFIL